MLDCPCMLFWQLEARTWHSEGDWDNDIKTPSSSHEYLATLQTRGTTGHFDRNRNSAAAFSPHDPEQKLHQTAARGDESEQKPAAPQFFSPWARWMFLRWPLCPEQGPCRLGRRPSCRWTSELGGFGPGRRPGASSSRIGPSTRPGTGGAEQRECRAQTHW